MQLMPGGVAAWTASSNSVLLRRASSVSSSYALSKWSSIARLLRPVMNIMSVMPAAAASSTAYWISGLSTIGSISFGLAFVAGRKRLPSPATGNTALVTLLNAIDQFLESVFIEDRDAEFSGAIEFAARIRPGHQKRCLPGDAARDLPAQALDMLPGRFPRHRRQRPGQHERLAGKCPQRRALGTLLGPMYPGGTQLGNHLAIVRSAEELRQSLAPHAAEVADLEPSRPPGLHQRCEIAEGLGKILGRR